MAALVSIARKPLNKKKFRPQGATPHQWHAACNANGMSFHRTT
jgi:hypothetical protein